MSRRSTPLAVHAQAYAQRNPRWYGVVIGLLTGVLHGMAMTAVLLFVNRSPVMSSMALGVLSGVLFGGFMGVYAVRTAFKEPLSPDTDRARMREARRVVRAGAPGPDPEANRVARQVAQAVLASPYWPGLQIVLFSLGLALNVALLVSAHTGPAASGPRWISLAGTALFAFLLFGLLPVVAHRRRRAQALLVGTAP